jgi:hypothetical protein
MADLARCLGGSAESSVGAVLASDVDSIELSVEVMLCLDGVRRTLARADILPLLGLRLKDFVGELDPAQNRPRNLDAAACI